MQTEISNKKMPRIILHATNFNGFWAHYSLLNDDFFATTLRNRGYELLKSNECDLKDDDYVLFLEAKSLNFGRYLLTHCGLAGGLKFLIRNILLNARKRVTHNSDMYEQCRKRNMLDRTLLLVLEGKIDAPENHSLDLGRLCKFIFTWNDDLVDNKKFIKTNWPQPIIWPEIQHVAFSKRKLLTNISANKFSSNDLELYSLRRKSIQYFENRFGDQFDLYGIGWNKPASLAQRKFGAPVIKFKSFKGEVLSKSDTFSKYRFALIYENAQVSGWITEKIFDCIRSMCVPIYLGAPNIDRFVPNDLYIDRQNFKNDEELADFLLKIDEGEYQKYLDNISSFLISREFTNHLSTALAEKIIASIESDESI